MGMGVLLQKEPKIPDAHKTSAAISGPKIADKNFTNMGIVLRGGGGYSRSWGRGGGAQVPGGCLGGVCNNCFFQSFQVAIL